MSQRTTRGVDYIFGYGEVNNEGPADWYGRFLERNNFWMKGHDHNHLRITRVIRCLRLLVDDDEADAFRIEVYSLLGDKLSSIPLRTRAFWDEA